jgi:hypothetical protein
MIDIIMKAENKFNRPSTLRGKVVKIDSNTQTVDIQCFGRVNSLVNVPYMYNGISVSIGDYVRSYYLWH